MDSDLNSASMTPSLDILVLPNLTPGGSGTGMNRLPYIYMQRNGYWVDISARDTLDLPGLRKDTSRLLDKLMASLDTNPKAELFIPLKSHGRVLYKHLIPRRLHEAFLELEQSGTAAGKTSIVNIHSSIEWIPWELFFDSDSSGDFLGNRFQLARLPITPTGPNVQLDMRVKVQRIYNLLGEHVLQETQQAEWQHTFDLSGIDPSIVENFPSKKQDKTFPSLGDLETMHDAGILHITCHGGVQSQDGSVFWTLNDRALIPEEYRIRREIVEMLAETIRLQRNTPLVFGNACASIKSSQQNSETEGGLVLGFGPTFFAHGAGAFVGTFAPVNKGTAVRFGRLFYQNLLEEKLPVGEALWQTRHTFARESVNDPSYLFYTLFGPAGLRFIT